jgi:very-short-patch-repair endonuclease
MNPLDEEIRLATERLNAAKVDRIWAAGEYDISLADVRCVRARIVLEAGVQIP